MSYQKSTYNAFPLNDKEANFDTLMYDWLTENQSYTLNFKEFLAWSRLAYGFEYMTTAGLPARTAVLRTA